MCMVVVSIDDDTMTVEQCSFFFIDSILKISYVCLFSFIIPFIQQKLNCYFKTFSKTIDNQIIIVRTGGRSFCVRSKVGEAHNASPLVSHGDRFLDSARGKPQDESRNLSP